jgi:hypothetical protein
MIGMAVFAVHVDTNKYWILSWDLYSDFCGVSGIVNHNEVGK